MNLVQLLLRSARWLPERPALALGATPVRSYREMAQRVSRMASGLHEKLGLQAGDRVALAMKNCPEFYELLFACWHAGMTAVPMNAKLHAKEFAYILEHSGAKVCFVTPELAAAIPSGIAMDEDLLLEEAAAPAEVKPDDPVCPFKDRG